MDNHNFLGIYDVLLDIKKEKNISPHNIFIPLLPSIIKFSQLMPADSINLRDDYCSTRYKAINFLKENEIIDDFKLHGDSHRWGQRVKILLSKSKNIDDVLSKMELDYRRRLKLSTKLTTDNVGSFWDLLHPKVVEISKSRFDSGHYADSVEAAFKELNDIIKSLAKQKTGSEYDGSDLMNRAFSISNPIITLADLSTESGQNIQKGFMQIFSGSMTGIRNPKTHQNIIIDEKRAIHFLYLASLLMYKIDEKVV